MRDHLAVFFMRKYLNISNENLKQAVSDDGVLNATALIICIKLSYSSSVIHKYDIKSLKTAFKSSSKTISSALKIAKEMGLLKEIDGLLVAKKIAIPYRMKSSVWRNETLSFDGEITIKNIKKELLKLSMVSYVRNRNKIYSLKISTREPKTLREYKKSRKNIIKWSLDKYDTSEGVSYSSIANKTNTSVRKVIYTVKELVKERVISKVRPELKKVNCFKKEFPLFFQRYSFEYGGMTFIQEPNRYSLVETNYYAKKRI